MSDVTLHVRRHIHAHCAWWGCCSPVTAAVHLQHSVLQLALMGLADMAVCLSVWLAAGCLCIRLSLLHCHAR